MGCWSSIKVEFEINCIEWTDDIEFVPTWKEINQTFIKSGFYVEMPFGYDAGYPDVKFGGDFVNNLCIIVKARDESLSEDKVIEWFHKQIRYLHPTRARLVVSEDFGSDLVIKYKDKVRIAVMKGEI